MTDTTALRLYAWVGPDDAGRETPTVKRVRTTREPAPLLAFDPERLRSEFVRTQMQNDANRFRTGRKLLVFTVAEVLEEIEPET